MFVIRVCKEPMSDLWEKYVGSLPAILRILSKQHPTE